MYRNMDIHLSCSFGSSKYSAPRLNRLMRRKGELLLLKSACLLLLDSLADLHANIHHTGCFQYLVEDQERLDSCIDQVRTLTVGSSLYFPADSILLATKMDSSRQRGPFLNITAMVMGKPPATPSHQSNRALLVQSYGSSSYTLRSEPA